MPEARTQFYVRDPANATRERKLRQQQIGSGGWASSWHPLLPDNGGQGHREYPAGLSSTLGRNLENKTSWPHARCALVRRKQNTLRPWRTCGDCSCPNALQGSSDPREQSHGPTGCVWDKHILPANERSKAFSSTERTACRSLVESTLANF